MPFLTPPCSEASAMSCELCISQVTGLILAGGASSRMRSQEHQDIQAHQDKGVAHHVDKGLLVWQGRPLVEHMLKRLETQVKSVAISANRNIEQYKAIHTPVWTDQKDAQWEDFPGPLAGMLTGLRQCSTTWLATVPCDAPLIPHNLVQKLYEQIRQEGVKIAFACTRASNSTPSDIDTPQKDIKDHPVFAVLHHSLADSLYDYMKQGDRKILLWMKQHPFVRVLFDEQAAFNTNINTMSDLVNLSEQPFKE